MVLLMTLLPDNWLFISKQMSRFWAYAPKRDIMNLPCATKIKNITPVVYSKCVGEIGIYLVG